MKAKRENLLLFSTVSMQGRDEEKFKTTEWLQIALQSLWFWLFFFLKESHPFWECIQFGTFRVHRSSTLSVMYGICFPEGQNTSRLVTADCYYTLLFTI